MRLLDGGDAVTGTPALAAALDLDMPWVLLACTRLQGSRLSCAFADRDLEIAAPAPLLREVVETFRRAAVPRRWLEQASSRWSGETLRDFLHYLISEGVLVPVAAMARGLWEYARNPRRFGEQPDSQTIARMVAEADARRDARIAEPRAESASTVRLRPAALERLRGLIEGRRSVRRFSCSPVALDDLAAIGWAMCGLVRRADGSRGGTTPSAGALYPLRFHFVNLRGQDGLPVGVYHMQPAPDGRVAYTTVSGVADELYATLGDPGLLDDAQGVAIISGAFARSGAKYGPRALSYVLLEAGHAAQNALLAAVDCGVGAVEIGGFNETPLARLLQLDEGEDPLIMLVLGSVAEAARDDGGTPPLVVEWVDTRAPPLPLSFHIARARYRDSEEWCWGRDANPRRAYLKASMEAEERAACGSPSGLREACMADLLTAVDPRELVAYSPAQYLQFDFPYAAFDPYAPCLWKEGARLDDGAQAHILADLVYFDTALEEQATARRHGGGGSAGRSGGESIDSGLDSQAEGHFAAGIMARRARDKRPYTSANSSGVAAHDTLEQAVESALLELIERDAFMRLWLGAGNAVPIPENRWSGRVAASVARMADAGVSVSLRQLRSPCDVPVAFVHAQSMTRGFTRVASCAHYALDVAVEHAMDELESQVAHTLSERPADSITPRQVRCAEDHGKLYAQRRYYRRAQHLLKLGTDMDPPPPTVMRPGLDSLRHAIRARDMSIYAIDLTRPERRDARVARVFVPGLIPIKFGYGNEPAGLRAVRELPRVLRKKMPLGFPHPFV